MKWPSWLRPGWIVLAIVALAFAYLCFTVLAPWQLNKNSQNSREMDQISRAVQEDPVPLRTFLPHQDSEAHEAQWRRVTATGHYLADKQILARLRVIDGEASYEVLNPFVVKDGPTVLINRGWVRPVQGTGMPQIEPAPTGEVTITARLRDSENAPPDRAPLDEDGVQQVYAIDTAQLAPMFGVPLTGSYLQLTPEQPGALSVRDLPHLDAGPFLSYGIQWIAFGILAPIGLGYFVYTEVKARRRERPAPTPEGSAPPPVTVEDKLADRYGRRR
ncbi:SURF1 family protein [[Mycobacterium] burgundiense]|uniref:SURF1-like protein n=1 Tax=[Mycobacterium] burgundiense TaxID=3064286 RepID=A0ABM9LN32_9MYCO|nr:SURF1 family protein [Mycolicibacterium sp. MU0053]CAJ1501752.1 SURF1 family protein [Mycolicibacterium sp. MU0053]